MLLFVTKAIPEPLFAEQQDYSPAFLLCLLIFDIFGHLPDCNAIIPPNVKGSCFAHFCDTAECLHGGGAAPDRADTGAP